MPQDVPAAADVTAAMLFQCLWEALVSLVGTPATAAMLRRGLKRAASRTSAAMPTVRRDGLDYAHDVPASWQDPARPDAVEELRRLVREDLAPSSSI